MWCRITTRCGRRSAWAAGAGSSSTSRPRVGFCPAMPPRPLQGSNSNRCAAIIRSPGSGSSPKPSTAIAARAGWPSRARAASSGKSTSAAAAARRLRFQVMPAIPIRPARCRRCTSRSSGKPRPKRRPATTASSIAILPGARRRRAATMAPDAEAGKSLNSRPDPFAPLTSQLLPVGDGHQIHVESVGRSDGIPAVYLHGGPGSGCQPDHRRLFDPERFHAVLFDQRGAGRSRPKGRREDNTLPHLIVDMEMIREKFGFTRWMIVGGSWGATLALAYAQAHPHRVTGIVLRATFLGTRAELNGAFLDALPRFYPGLSDDFLKVLPEEERAQPLDAYWRRILDSDPAVHGPAARAWHDTERILSEHTSGRVRLDPDALNSTRALPFTPFMEAHYFQNNCFMRPNQLLAEAGKLEGILGVIVQGRYDLLCPPATSHALDALWPASEVRFVEGAGHSLYDPGIRDAVMKAISDLASRITG